MAKTITEVDTATDTFEIWVNRTNEVINTVANEVLTANTNANGAQVTGNSFLNGVFGSNTISVATSLRGGNVQSTTVLNVGSNVSIGTGNTLFISTGTTNAVANATTLLHQNSTFTHTTSITGSVAVAGSNTTTVNTLIVSLGTTSVNTQINSTAVSISNSTVTFDLTKPLASEVSDGGYYLNANGSWALIDVTEGGANQQVLFNDSGSSNGESTFTYNKANNTMQVTGTAIVSGTMDVSGVFDDTAANAVSQTLTDATTVNWNTASGRVATVTLGGNRTMAAPTNLKIGTYILSVIQDGTGSRTLTWNSVFKWPGGIAPTLTTTASARDVFSFFSDGTNMYGSMSIPNAS